MAKRKRTDVESPVSVRLGKHLMDWLRTIQERVGIPVAEQISRGVQEWLEKQEKRR